MIAAIQCTSKGMSVVEVDTSTLSPHVYVAWMKKSGAVRAIMVWDSCSWTDVPLQPCAGLRNILPSVLCPGGQCVVTGHGVDDRFDLQGAARGGWLWPIPCNAHSVLAASAAALQPLPLTKSMWNRCKTEVGKLDRIQWTQMELQSRAVPAATAPSSPDIPDAFPHPVTWPEWAIETIVADCLEEDEGSVAMAMEEEDDDDAPVPQHDDSDDDTPSSQEDDEEDDDANEDEEDDEEDDDANEEDDDVEE